MTQNMRDIRGRRFSAASRNAESAARISLRCGDRWHAANELMLAAEMAHESGERQRAAQLLRNSVAMMRSLRAARRDTLTSTLLAQRLDAGQKALQGQWTYW